MADQKPSVVTTPEEVEQLRAEQATEYGTYVAVAPISFNGAPAYNPGDPVPVSNVQRHKYDEQGLVAKVGTKAGQELITALATPAEPAAETPAPVSLNVVVK